MKEITPKQTRNPRTTKRASIIIKGDGFYKFYINNPSKNRKELKFSNNEIDTTKYNIFTFLPKALFFQFARPANIYFLISAILQNIPMISPLKPLTAILPLVIVLSVSLIREGMEDYTRYKLDKQQNNEKCDKYNSNKRIWEQSRSGDLYVGDIISIKENETFPADVILIDSNLPEGICYVETGSLDGEKTLKLKEASKITGGLYNNEGEKSTIFYMEGTVLADQPNPELYSLNGKIHLKYNNNILLNSDQLKVIDIPLDSKQLLLKGAKLKNTQWVIGIVVYSGLNCKIMKNSKDPVTKYSSMQKDKYSYSKIRKKFLRVNSVSLNEECGMINYIFTDKTGTLTCNKMVFKYCVIGETCYQYIRDNLEENNEKEKKFRIEENIIPYKSYEMYDNFEGIKDSLNFNNKQKDIIITSESDNDIKLVLKTTKDIIEQFFYALALCHTCSIQLDENGNQEYACVSPDSIELVKAAKYQGWELIESGTLSIKRIKLGKDRNNFIDFERLELIEFSSDRKRESVIVKEKEGNTNIIKLYIKGADSVIEERLSKKTPSNILNQCKYYVNKFSVLGFRTLFIAMKILSQEEFSKFSNDLKEAQMSLENKDEKVNQVYNDLEQNLILLGATIVEDKLQDSVPETIRDLRLAKVKVWMLTGDKMNTAYNIGLSCNLISKKMKTFSIKGKEKKVNQDLEDINKSERDQVILNFAKEFQGFKNNFNSMVKPSFGILVDEKALLTVSQDEEIQKIFLEIAKEAETVICCRVSPLQKSQVVKMMKNYDTKGITLAIGDGGNDVPMIMEAHIGVGIYGEEGLRAVQSSDFAIGEFKILRELLFSHGRMNNMRNSECIHYFFFKNFVETFNHFVFGFFNNFTGQTIIDDWFITLYNLLFTSLPLGTKAILDIDICRDDGNIVYKMLPFIYKENRDNPILTLEKFFFTLIKGLIYSLINSLFVIYSINHIQINKKGQMAGLWFMSVNIYTNILIIVTTTLVMTTKYHTWIHIVILLIVTVIAYICFIFIVQHLTMFNSVGTMQVAFTSPVLWLNIILICGFSGLIEYFILSFFFVFKPNTASTLQRIYNQNGVINEEENLPKSIKEKIGLYNQIEQSLDNMEIKNDEINGDNNLKNIKIDGENDDNDNNINNKKEKEEDEKSEEIRLNKDDIEVEAKTDFGKEKDINVLKSNKLNMSKISNKSNKQNEEHKEDNKEQEEFEDIGENYEDNFSERMSKEGNIDIKNSNYFKEPWNLRNKIKK